MADEKILEKVRKLLAQAEDRAGTPEGDAFSARAEELMIRHGIEQAVLDEAEGKDKGEVGATRVWVPAPYAKQKASLLCQVAGFNQGYGIIHEPLNGWSKGCAVSVFGFERDRETIEFLFTSLSVQATRGVMKAEVPFNPWRGKREDAASYRASWLMGFRDGVVVRMREMQQRVTEEVKRESSGAELVLASKEDQVKAHVEDLYPNLGQLKMSSSGSGRRSGFAAGRNADIGNKRMGSGSRAALGR